MVRKDHRDGAIAERLPQADRVGAGAGWTQGKHAALHGVGVGGGFRGALRCEILIGRLTNHLLALHRLFVALLGAMGMGCR